LIIRPTGLPRLSIRKYASKDSPTLFCLRTTVLSNTVFAQLILVTNRQKDIGLGLTDVTRKFYQAIGAFYRKSRIHAESSQL
jgi:hypothetical protein